MPVPESPQAPPCVECGTKYGQEDDFGRPRRRRGMCGACDARLRIARKAENPRAAAAQTTETTTMASGSASRNGVHESEPRRVGAIPYQSRLGTAYMAERWTIPGLGVRWYGVLAGRYLTPTGFDKDTIDGAAPFGNAAEVAAAVDAHEAATVAERPVARAAAQATAPARVATMDPLPEPGRRPRRVQVFRCRGRHYQLQEWGPTDWRVLYPGGSVANTARNPGFRSVAEAQAAAERHAMQGQRTGALVRVGELTAAVAAGRAELTMERGERPGETIARFYEPPHAPDLPADTLETKE